MKIVRPPNWAVLLEQFVILKSKQPFAWRTNDCCTFAVDWLQTLNPELGVLDTLGIQYEDEHSALRVVKKWGSLSKIASAVLGDPMASSIFSKRGDICLANYDGRETLMVNGGSSLIGPGAEGLVALPAYTNIITSWSV